MAESFRIISSIVRQYYPMFLRGAGVTMLIAIIGTVAGLTIGLAVGTIRAIPLDSPHGRGGLRRWVLRIVRFFFTFYVELFRGTPMIVQAVFIYYGLTTLFGIQTRPIPCGIMIVSINTGAYMAEIVRGGIESIDPGQTEAAHAIGMTHWQTMANVILPQTIRNILPATGNEFVINIKDTSVLNIISVTELFFQSRSVLGILYKNFEVYTVTIVIYFVLTFTTTRILRALEKRMDGPRDFTLATSSTMPESIIRRPK